MSLLGNSYSFGQKKHNFKLFILAVTMICLASSLPAQVLVDNFATARVPWSSFVGTLYSNASGASGQVDVGYFTVNDNNSSNNDWMKLVSYSANPNNFNISGVTGFNISMRREAQNTAANALLYVVSNNDSEFTAAINLSNLSTTTFTDIYIPITALGLSSGVTSFMDISISGDYLNGTAADTYNFSVDSIRAVPEPSALSLLALGLSGFLAVRRRRSS